MSYANNPEDPNGANYYSKPRMNMEKNRELLQGNKVGSVSDPGKIDFRNLLNKDGKLSGDMTAGMNEQALGRMRSIAGGGAALNDPFNRMMEQNSSNLTADLGHSSKLAATGADEAQSNLAQTGGVSSAASDRIARAGKRNLMMSQQRQRAGSADRGMGILQQKADVQRNAQEMLPQAELGKLSVDEFNLKNRLGEKRRQDGLQNRIFGEQMKSYGADVAGNAYANSAPEQSIFGKLTGGLLG